MRPRNTRDEYHFANLNVKVMSIIEEQELERDHFTVQIRMPCIEVLSEITDETIADSQPRIRSKFFRTTVAHFLTGRQMVDLIKGYRLFEWVEVAK